MNEKIKRFSFGAENSKTGNGRCARIVRPELIILSIIDKKSGKRIRRVLVVSIHNRIRKLVNWNNTDLIELSLMGEDLNDAVLSIDTAGYRMAPTSKNKTARWRIFIPVPDGYERFSELKAVSECIGVECEGDKIAFKMPF